MQSWRSVCVCVSGPQAVPQATVPSTSMCRTCEETSGSTPFTTSEVRKGAGNMEASSKRSRLNGAKNTQSSVGHAICICFCMRQGRNISAQGAKKSRNRPAFLRQTNVLSFSGEAKQIRATKAAKLPSGLSYGCNSHLQDSQPTRTHRHGFWA